MVEVMIMVVMVMMFEAIFINSQSELYFTL